MDREYLTRLTRELTDSGKLIEAGWVGFRLAVVPEDASKTQLEETRKAFFAGAQHLFASIMNILDDDREPTPADLRRMELISNELEVFAKQLKTEVWGRPI